MPGKVEFMLCNNLSILLQQRHLLTTEYAWASPQFFATLGGTILLVLANGL